MSESIQRKTFAISKDVVKARRKEKELEQHWGGVAGEDVVGVRGQKGAVGGERGKNKAVVY